MNVNNLKNYKKMKRLNREQKLNYLYKADLGLFVKTRQTVFDELSDQQTMFCCCGKLATGLHERNCTKFNNKVDAETINRLGHLLPKKGCPK